MDNKLKYDFLEKELKLFIEYNNYMLLHFANLYWHLNELTPLKQVLLSDTIRMDKAPLEITATGEKIFFDLYKYLRLVKSQKVRDWLILNFPKMEVQYISIRHNFMLACIDSFNLEVIEEEIAIYKDLDKMIRKFG